jgi:quinohemoprotein ethanol dehydrogenase
LNSPGFALKAVVLGLAILFISSCSRESEQRAEPEVVIEETEVSMDVDPAAVDGERIADADAEPGNWMTHGRTYSEQRYSQLESINDSNVGSLGLAWHVDLDTARGQEATPLVIDGIMYVSTAWSMVKALDASTGELLWSFDPEVPRAKGLDACCDVVNRGVAAWEGRIYVGALDGRLISLDAATGEPLWSTATFDPESRYTITGAPRVVKGNVIIGNGGAELGVRGYVSAYDAETGELAWRFYTVPGNPEAGFESEAMEFAAETWTGEWWQLGGGGTVWDSMAYDPELDLLYIGVGNGSPWNQSIRSPEGGDNLFLSSIVALRPDTGEYVWHYQTTPGETWDFTATQHIILADIVIGDTPRQVLMQAPKNGFFYVLDRITGELISAHNYVPLTWAEGVDPETGRPIEAPNARYYANEDNFALLQPGPGGAHSWQPMSFSPETGLVYIPAMEAAFPYFADTEFEHKEMAWNTGADFGAGAMPEDPEIQAGILSHVNGHLSAWDPVAGEEKWRAQHPGAWNAGVLTTSGNLLIQGQGDGNFSIYRADTGEKLWSFFAQSGIVAAPVTYLVDGEQYIAVVVGWGGIMSLAPGLVGRKGNLPRNISRVLAFKLGGSDSLPPAPPEPELQLVVSDREVDEEELARGKHVYHQYCVNCHGDIVVSAGVVPDLRYSAMVGTDAWNSVVRDGILESRGMVGFGAVLSDEDIRNIESYVIVRARNSAGAEE